MCRLGKLGLHYEELPDSLLQRVLRSALNPSANYDLESYHALCGAFIAIKYHWKNFSKPSQDSFLKVLVMILDNIQSPSMEDQINMVNIIHRLVKLGVRWEEIPSEVKLGMFAIYAEHSFLSFRQLLSCFEG